VSTRKPPDVRGLLLEGNFARSGELPHSDPLTITQMLLEVERIQPYERNPRKGQNPRYVEIKASVRAQGGLNNPLTVTRRPGEDDYRVEAGGNTRLQILKELWAETADERFRRIHCLFVPWRSESHVLGAHLIENELRGDLRFIEKAQAIRDLQTQLEQESGAPLSRSALQRALSEIGYSVSRRQLIRYDYALERLEPLIPKALQAGLGRQQVDQLRDLEAAYQGIAAASLNDPTAFDRWFCAALAELDSETLEVNQVRTALDASLAKLTGQLVAEIQRARVRSADSSAGKLSAESGADEPLDTDVAAVDEIGASVMQSAGNPEQAGVEQGTEFSEPRTSGGQSDPPGKPASGPEKNLEKKAVHKTGLSITDHWGAQAQDAGMDAYLTEELNTGSEHLPRETDLKSLRSRAFVLATRIAQALGFQAAISPWKSGYGFSVDLPEVALETSQACQGWWLLLGLSEQAVSDERLNLLPQQLRLPQALLASNEALVCAQVSSPPPASLLPFQLLLSRQLPDRAFQDLLRLLECCRILRRNFRESDLWECITVEQVRLRAELSGLAGGADD